MNLVKQKTDTVIEHLKRILGATSVVTTESTNKDFNGITITTPTGTVDFRRGQYGSEVDISCTVPETEFALSFKAFDSCITKGFKTEKERDDFFETLPEEQKTSAAKSTRTI